MKKFLRNAVALGTLAESLAFFMGTLLHLGAPLPVPFVESTQLSTALIETAAGVFLLVAAAAVLTHRRRAWQTAVAAHVAGVVAITYGIAQGGGAATHASHHRLMLLVLVVALIVIATPPVRHALGNGRRRRHRHHVMQSL